MKWAWIALLICLPCEADCLDTLLVVPKVDPSIVSVGQPFNARIAIASPDTSWQLFGPPAPSEAGPLDIRSSRAADVPDSSVWEFECALFDVGEMYFPPIPFMYTNQIETVLVITEPYRISVESSLPADSSEWALHDIQGPIAPDTKVRWIRLALTAALLTAIALALVWWRKRDLPDAVIPEIPKDPPHVEALRSLRQLDAKTLPARGLFKEHFVEISHIMRVYLQRRFLIPAVESTTDEIAAHLKHQDDPRKETAAELLGLLEEADLVKFAKYKPSMDQSRDAVLKSESWVEQTTLQEAPPEPSTGEDADHAI
jgi:hypothetical protein